MKINLPNQITLARLLVTVVFFVLLAGYDQKSPAPGLLNVCFSAPKRSFSPSFRNPPRRSALGR